ncbi:MAG: winged helix-turn-helix domain-containing protein, partial [Clostridia bacterium]|nr:winged helix-turn-helix domain-containing protein [Clostridia bacterium]
MADIIRIQMMDTFAIYINERRIDLLVNKSRKGASLIQLLLSHRGKSVPNNRILTTLWQEDKSSNPENALKTLVSRLRTLLNQISPELGSCLVADRGAYHWELLPG